MQAMSSPSPWRSSTSDKVTERLPADERRESLLAAAAEIVRDAGSRQISVEAIATRAGVSKPILYRHFASRTALLEALIEERGAEMLRRLATRGAEGDDWDARTRDQIMAVLELARDDPAGWRLLFAEEFDEPELRRAQRALRARATRELAERYAAGGFITPPGMTRKQATTAAAAFVRAAIDGLVAWWEENPKVDADALADYATALVRRGVSPLWRG
jgi:AcrR family transcriptional regulator